MSKGEGFGCDFTICSVEAALSCPRRSAMDELKHRAGEKLEAFHVSALPHFCCPGTFARKWSVIHVSFFLAKVNIVQFCLKRC